MRKNNNKKVSEKKERQAHPAPTPKKKKPSDNWEGQMQP